MASAKERLALGIVDFLQTSVNDGTIADDSVDSVQVAIECLQDVFNIDMSQKDTILGQQSLLSIFQAFEKVRDSRATETTPVTPASSSSSGNSVSPELKAQAEVLKAEGNRHVATRSYPQAIEAYTKAIELDPYNPIYYSNRAAVYSSSKQHELAVKDAEKALEIDPKYAKGYSRLGLAKFALGDAEGAMSAYGKGIEIEGNGGSDVMRRGYETAKARVDEEINAAVPSETATRSSTAGEDAGGLAGLASMLGGAGGAGGAGGLAGLANMLRGAGGEGGMDFASIMNNPMFQSMAQRVASNPNMMRQMQDLMNDGDIANIAQSFMGGNRGGNNSSS
ncbi:hypothetical protein V1511DRAFT_488932 [Dipodascopsis uninucleata]